MCWLPHWLAGWLAVCLAGGLSVLPGPPHLGVVPHDVCVVEPLGGQLAQVVPVHVVGTTHAVTPATQRPTKGVVPAGGAGHAQHTCSSDLAQGAVPVSTHPGPCCCCRHHPQHKHSCTAKRCVTPATQRSTAELLKSPSPPPKQPPGPHPAPLPSPAPKALCKPPSPVSPHLGVISGTCLMASWLLTPDR